MKDDIWYGKIPNDWDVVLVRGLVKRKIIFPPKDGNHGNLHPKNSDFVEEGIPFIMANDIINGEIDFANCKKITQTMANTLQKGFAKSRDVLLTHKATIGRTAIVRTNLEYIILTPQVTYYRIKDDKHLNNIYLKYLFDSKRFRQILNCFSGGGSTRDYIGITQQLELPILFPSIDDQKYISEPLSTLDLKINLLRRQNETLEAIAQALFKRWFVEFEFPNKEGQPYKSSGGKLVSSELGEIPKGWSKKCFYELGAYINGGAFKQEDFSQHNAGLPIIKIVELKYGITDQTKYTEKQVADKIIINDKDILFSWSGSPETSIDIFVWNLGRGVLNQHTFKVIPNKSIERTWLYNLLKFYKPLFIRIAKQKQTTGLGHVTVSDLRENRVVFPNNKILTKYNLIADPIFKKYYLNLKEINTLSKLRDILLPKLMSGQIRVK